MTSNEYKRLSREFDKMCMPIYRKALFIMALVILPIIIGVIVEVFIV